MKNQIQAQAAHKVAEAMSGLRGALKAATPTARREIHACMCELRSIQSDLDDLDAGAVVDAEEEAAEAEEEAEDEPMDVLAEDEGDDDEEGALEDMDDDELAASALELAASALEQAAADDAAALRADFGDEEDEEEEDEFEEEDEEGSEDEFVEDEAEDDAAALGEELAEDEPMDGEDDGLLEEEESFSEDSEEILTDEELAELEREGLVEGSFKTISSRIRDVQNRLQAMSAEDEDAEATDASDDDEFAAPVAPYVDVGETSEEFLTTAEYHQALLAMTPAERRECRLLEARGGLVSAAKRSATSYKQSQKSALHNRKIRKYRGKWKQSDKGKKASITTTGGRKKVIRQKFYYSTYDNSGKFLGTFWASSKKPNENTVAAYKKKHGVKHPSALNIVDPVAKWNKKPGKGDKKRPAKKK